MNGLDVYPTYNLPFYHPQGGFRGSREPLANPALNCGWHAFGARRERAHLSGPMDGAAAAAVAVPTHELGVGRGAAPPDDAPSEDAPAQLS